MGGDFALVIFAVLFPVLLVGELALLAVLWRSGGGRLPRIVEEQAVPAPADQVANEVWSVSLWLVATAATMSLAFVAAFIAVHVLLFTFGTEVAFIGLISSAIVLAAIPVVIGLVMRRRTHSR
jgi:hypothetical protein